MTETEIGVRNARLYPRYVGLFNAFFWMPVFFLFFSELLSVAEVLRLEAIYYLSVVLLEVPSGYFSDRVGRKPTLLISSVALTIGYMLFAFSSSFITLAAAQFLLAGGIAFNSGTDVSFHYDSLASAGREEEFADREARVAKLSFLASAVAALLGGAIGMVSLRFAYILSAIAALASVIVVLQFREPASHERPTTLGVSFVKQLKSCVAYLRSGTLAWLFGISISMVVLNHIPYEFYQPYARLLGIGKPEIVDATPMITGALAAVVGVIASWVAGRSVLLSRRIGFRNTMLCGIGLQTLVIGLLGIALHPIILVLVIMRGVPRALMTAPMNAVIAPAVSRDHRATYLSLQSLAGRFAFSVFLAVLSLAGGDAGSPTWPVLSELLLISGGVGLAILGLAAATMWIARSTDNSAATSR